MSLSIVDPGPNREIDYKKSALKVGEVLMAFRQARSTAAYDQKLLWDLEKLYLDLVRRARWRSPMTEDPFLDEKTLGKREREKDAVD